MEIKCRTCGHQTHVASHASLAEFKAQYNRDLRCGACGSDQIKFEVAGVVPESKASEPFRTVAESLKSQ